jgi:hypothetical protein
MALVLIYVVFYVWNCIIIVMRDDFNKILNWIELLCIIVLYVYMFCYVNKIIETISCLFSLNWNRMFKQWRSINNYSSNRKKNTTSKQTINIYILMNIHVFGLRQAYIFNRVKSVNVIANLFPLVNWISNINRYKQTNKKKKKHIYIHWNLDLGLRGI